jgi:DNA-binding PadR family transcriptional regulator
MIGEELRRIVLKQFFDRRTTEYFTPMRALVCEAGEGNLADICDQLAKDGLIDWYRSASNPDRGSGRITERGVNVIQGITSTASSQTDPIKKLITAVDRSSASEQEKKQAKILLENLASNGLIMAALGTLLGGGSAH